MTRFANGTFTAANDFPERDRTIQRLIPRAPGKSQIIVAPANYNEFVARAIAAIIRAVLQFRESRHRATIAIQPIWWF